MAEDAQDAPVVTAVEAATRAELIDATLVVEGFQKAFGSYGERLVRELTERAVAELQKEGTAPTWRSPGGVGKITLNNPQPKAVVVDDRAFASWLAERRPEQVTATIGVDPKDLPNILALLEEQGYLDVNAKVEPHPAYVTNYTDPKKGPLKAVESWPDCEDACMQERKRVCAHRPLVEYVDETLGEIVPGIKRRLLKEPYISRGLDPATKESISTLVHAWLEDRLSHGVTGSDDPLALLGATTIEVPAEAAPPLGYTIDLPEPEDGGDLYRTPDGVFRSPLHAAAHAVNAQGGYSTVDIEAKRMLADGGRSAEVAQEWLDSQLEVSVNCRCEHSRDAHRRGPKAWGKCQVDDCPCKRFAERKL